MYFYFQSAQYCIFKNVCNIKGEKSLTTGKKETK